MQAYSLNKFPKNNQKVIFLLSGWGNKQIFFWPIAKFLQSKGFYCITLAFDKNFFSWDIKKTVKNFAFAKETILKEIKILKKQGYKQFYIFGTSLGSVLSIMIANNSKDVSKVILNLIGDDLAEIIWTWNKAVPGFKKELIKNKITKKIVKEMWKELSPVNNLTNLKSKRFLIFLSKKDKIIPYEFGQRFLREMKKKELGFELYENNHLGHFGTATYNLLRSRTYLDFLKS
jgi:esterase/lipase